MLIAACSYPALAPAGGAGDDARPPDDVAAPDGAVCYGAGLVKICLAKAPTMPLTIEDAAMVDTTNNLACAETTNASNYCVVAATAITINATLRGTGIRPLVLIASDSILINELVDVGSHRVPVELIGAGADPMSCTAGAAPGAGGGGAGGSFTGAGGTGGSGATGGAGGRPALPLAAISELRGGCPGQDGNGSGRGAAGHGGGAIYVIAGNRIDITGPGINASGEGGAPGMTSASGAGGGGAGGMIGLDAPTIACGSTLIANGGGGGEGSGPAIQGASGSDPMGTGPADGGNGNTTLGGDGGHGSAGTSGGPGASGGAGTTNAGSSGGGGGGGGGAGLIKGPPTALGASVSPSATP